MSNRYSYEGSEQFRPLSPWSYFWYSVLFALPVIGLISLLVFSFNSTNINRRNFARSFWCAILMAILVALIIFGLSAAGVLPDVNRSLEYYRQVITAPMNLY